ncbi:MAG: Txe/YoeB family addiction module toxin [Puniceicoccales bacterium]|jgi:toxin YoeB|nr:Txe/YoeB family addiction module toxin [Puniceicoccales bacterium]
MNTPKKFSTTKSFDRDFEKLLRTKDGFSRKMQRLFEEVLDSPFTGGGLPEKLSGYGDRNVWSRRISEKHRMVYEVAKDEITFLRCYGHYDDH